MSDENRSRLIRTTALFIFVVVALGGISLGTTFTIGDFGFILPYMPDNLAPVGISMLLVPMIAGITLFYFGILVAILFEGELARVLTSSFYAGGFAGFIAIFMIIQPVDQKTSDAGLYVLGAFAVFFIYSLLSAISRIREQFYIRVVAGSATIFIMGQVAVQIIRIYMIVPGTPTSDQASLIIDMFNWGFSAAAGIALIGVFKDNKNPYMSQIGGIASSYLFVVAVSLIGTLYVNFIGGRLARVSPVIVNLVPWIQWTGIVVVAALIFTVMRRGMQESLMKPADLGTWMKHVQDLSATKGPELENFTEIITEFVVDGRKDRLLVKLFQFLRENRASESEMVATLKDLINYIDESSPSFARRGTSQKLQEQNREMRMLVLEKTVGNINSLGLGGLMPQSEEKTGIMSQVQLSILDRLEG